MTFVEWRKNNCWFLRLMFPFSWALLWESVNMKEGSFIDSPLKSGPSVINSFSRWRGNSHHIAVTYLVLIYWGTSKHRSALRACSTPKPLERSTLAYKGSMNIKTYHRLQVKLKSSAVTCWLKDGIMQLTHDYLRKTQKNDDRPENDTEVPQPVRPAYGSDRSDSRAALLSW